MHKTLDLLIEEFRVAQEIGVSTLRHDLKIPLPTSEKNWFQYCCENNLYEIKNLNGIGIYAHGYGIELKIGTLTIDFDWGAKGEPDGFDGWRLYNFSRDNLPKIKCEHLEVNSWFESALEVGELIKGGKLYYDPDRRAMQTTNE